MLPDDTAAQSIRVSPAVGRALADSVSRASDTPENLTQRSTTRTVLPPGVRVIGEVAHPGGSSHRFLATIRDISRGGLSMLHGGFLHKDSRCDFIILAPDNSPPPPVTGFVIRCSHVKGSVHDIGIRFESPIPLDTILSGTPSTATPNYAPLIRLCEQLLTLLRAPTPIDLLHTLSVELSDTIAAERNNQSKAA